MVKKFNLLYLIKKIKDVMRLDIKVRLFATLREGRGKELFVDLDEPLTPMHIVDKLNIPIEEVAILLINGRDGQLNTLLTEGDVVSIFPPVGGG
jgi:molybdopterin converting factor small subunit